MAQYILNLLFIAALSDQPHKTSYSAIVDLSSFTLPRLIHGNEFCLRRHEKYSGSKRQSVSWGQLRAGHREVRTPVWHPAGRQQSLSRRWKLQQSPLAQSIVPLTFEQPALSSICFLPLYHAEENVSGSTTLTQQGANSS